MHQLRPQRILLLIAARILLKWATLQYQNRISWFCLELHSIRNYNFRHSAIIMMHSQHSRARLNFSWGAEVVRPSRSTPPYEQFLPLPSPLPIPTPFLSCFGRDSLMLPNIPPPLHATSPPPKNFDRTTPPLQKFLWFYQQGKILLRIYNNAFIM